MRCPSLVLFVSLFLISFSSTKGKDINVDSLKQVLDTDIRQEERIKVLLNLSKSYSRIDLEIGKKYLDEALDLAQKNGYKNLEAKSKKMMIGEYLPLIDLDSANLIAIRVLDYYKEINDKNNIQITYRMLSLICNRLGQFETAKRYLQEGLSMEGGDPVTTLSLYSSLAGVQFYLQEYDQAIITNFKALELAEQLNHKFGKIITNSHIAAIYFSQGSYENALNYYQKSILEFDTITPERNLAILYKDLAATNAELNKTEDALSILRTAMKVAKKLNFKEGISLVKLSQAEIYVTQNIFPEETAKILFELESDSITFQHNRAGIEVVTAQHHKNNQEYSLALTSAQKALKILEKFLNPKQQASMIKLISEIYHIQKNYQSAFEYQSKYYELTDSIANLSKAESIKVREAEYEFKKERSEQEKIFATKTQAQRQFNLFAAIFTAILAVLSFLLFKTARNRKNLADELQQKNEALSALNEAKTRFFANVSHELKTPLSLILNPLQKLKKRKNLPDEDQYLIKTAERKSLELFDLTNQILELTKFEVDKVDTQKVDLNLPYLLKKTYAEFESLAHSKKVKLQFDFVGQDDLTIQTDEYKLKTILKNLLSNALKFTEAGGEVKVTATERADTLEFQVRDNGRGIHAQDLPYVFDRYFQTNRPASISEGGTGIGLAICKEYSKLLGGDIRVQSEYGQFSLFTLTITKVLADNPLAAPTIPTSPRQNAPNPSVFVENRTDLPTILLVEDNMEMQEYMRYTLQEHYQIIVAGNGAEGLQILQEAAHPVQLILSDVMMPVMNGYEFLEKVKDTPRFAAIPLIMLTALSDSKYKLKGLRIGVDDYLTKPVMEEELLARIDNLLANADEKRFYQTKTEISELEATTAITTSTLSNGEIEAPIDIIDVMEQKVSREDLAWLANLEEKVSEQLENTLLTVDDLAYQTAMSRSAFYRKIKTLTGLTPNQYINQIRFERARQLLETKQFANIKTVAFKVGFKSRKYFSRNFKQRYGKYPSEYVE